jgi:hypothetical protein
MIDKTDLITNLPPVILDLSFPILLLLGLLAGWVRRFPLWSYSYLGWTLVIAWWWSGIYINGTYWGYLSLLFLGVTVVIGLLWTRSFDPIKKLFKDIWADWTRLSLAMYTFVGFAFLIYDENHHPYLLAFMATSTLAFTAGAWFFLRIGSLIGRIASIYSGFITGSLIAVICDRTWDSAAYYNLPEGTPNPWYSTIFQIVMILAFYSMILLWPAVIALLNRVNDRPLKPQKSN